MTNRRVYLWRRIRHRLRKAQAWTNQLRWLRLLSQSVTRIPVVDGINIKRLILRLDFRVIEILKYLYCVSTVDLSLVEVRRQFKST